MADFRIVRDATAIDGPTTGTLYAGDLDIRTLELPWRDNRPNISCIPKGRYKVTLAYSHRFKKVMPRLLNVPGRDGILIHPGNTALNTEGCILVGMKLLTGGLIDSKEAFKLFFRWLSEAQRDGDVFAEVSYA